MPKTNNTLDTEIHIALTRLENAVESDCRQRFGGGATRQLASPKIIHAEAFYKLKSLIANREKQMLEFVIGKDESTNPNSYDGLSFGERSVKEEADLIRNELKQEQRQRAKEWEGT